LLWVLEENHAGLSSQEISRRLEVSERTVRRDLQTLRSTGYPLTSVGSKWLFIEGQGLPTSLASDGAAEEISRDRILSLDRAVRSRHPIEAVHWSPGPLGEVKLDLAPLALHFFEGSLFLVAREHPPAGRWRTVAVERLARIEVSHRRFPRSVNDGLESYLAGQVVADAATELIRVLVRFDPEISWRVAGRIWHPSQRVFPQDDGSVIAVLRVPGLAWVTAWVLGFGPGALVLSPPGLVRGVLKALHETQAKYASVQQQLSQLDLFENGT
jgi:predicted DNA-binding transcriptional regulator YafY